MRSTTFPLALCAVLALGTACDKKNDTSNAPADDNLVGGAGGGDGVGDDLDLGGDDFGDEGEFAAVDEDFKPEPWPKIDKPKKPVEKCKGKGKNRECSMVDPTPKVSAAVGTRSMMGNYRFGMTPSQVFYLMSKDIEEEYDAKQKATSDPMEQDRNREWKKEQLQSLKAGHVKFTKASKHRWGVSLIQFEYEDDANEEMLWVKANPTLRKFYFFKDDELWKILYAYSSEAWPGMPYAEVVEQKFMKWFGPSPANKDKRDPKTDMPVLEYFEWESADNALVRSFDMQAVNGVIVLAVIDKDAESRIGERLPNVGRDESFSEGVQDVLGGKDVCYDDAGDIVECGEDGGGKSGGKIDI